MKDFSVITDHPLSKDILSKLLSGSTPKEVSKWLKLKYSSKKQTHLRLSQVILKEFVDSQYTNVYDQFKQDLVEVSKEEKEMDKKMSASLLNNKTYRERLQDIANKEFNILKMLDSLIIVTQQRLEQVFDSIQAEPEKFKGDAILLKYINTIFDIAEKLEKIRIGSPDLLSQQNITVQVIEEQTAILQDAVRRSMMKVDPDMAMAFMDILYNELNELKPVPPMSQEKRLDEAQILHEKVIDIVGDDMPDK